MLLLVCGLTHAQELKPYLQMATPYSIYVNWKTNANPETIVEWGTTPESLTETVEGTTQIMSDTGYAANYFYHQAKIEGLNPNTKYYYRTRTGEQTSEILTFKTHPLPGEAATADGKLRFLIMGDNQMRNVPRYDTLVAQAKRKIAELNTLSQDPGDYIALTVMVGDQVDVGTLDHYEHVHMRKNTELSGQLPITTLVGNHETYGTLGMQAYYDHFVLDEMNYGNLPSGTEDYYANQVGNVLFINLDTEHTSATQLSWMMQVLNYANQDETVDWIVSLGHRPYQAEQYIGDISTWIRTTVMPILVTSPKHVLHVGAHHHIYHRGQLKNTPTYQIISGGTAWDQYWGMANEADYDDVQKTISQWAYQIIEVDVNHESFKVDTYSMGSKFTYKDNVLIDSFARIKGLNGPETPAILTELDGQDIELPFEIETSAYATTEEIEMNSTEFMIGKTADFTIVEKSVYRDYENLFGPLNGQTDESEDINAGLDITKLTVGAGELPNGEYFIRYRQRDRNLNWSAWSQTRSFNVINSEYRDTSIALDSIHFDLNAPIQVHYTDGPNAQGDWIGLYKKGQTPGAATPSLVWQYTTGSSGTLTFPTGLEQVGVYYAAFMTAGGYEEIAPRKSFYVGPWVSLATAQNVYPSGSSVTIDFENAPALPQDWIGIYKVSHQFPEYASTRWSYTTGTEGSVTLNNVPDGYYYAVYLMRDGYDQNGERIYFQVGELLTSLTTNKVIYELNESIQATWANAPGLAKDWIGIYPEGTDPNIDEFVSYTYFDGIMDGSIAIPEENLPQSAGNYYIVMFTNDSYTEVSNRVEFVVENDLGLDQYNANNAVSIYPNPSANGENTYIQSKYPIEKIDLYDAMGNLFYTTKNVNELQYSFINQNLPTGVYLVRIHSNKLYTVKMIVK